MGYRLLFTMEGRAPVVHLALATTLRLRCQRCLEPFGWPVDTDVRLKWVGGPLEAERLDPGFEPLLLPEGGLVNPRDLIEDELLLAVPQVPRHPFGTCRADWASSLEDDAPRPQENPFAVLARCKR